MTMNPSPTIPPASPALHVDTHLVMNALNQLVALDSSGEGPMSSLIFMLSDYLRESLSTLEYPTLPLSMEIALVQAHVQLAARVARQTLHMSEVDAPSADPHVARGCLSQVGTALIKLMRGANECRLELDLDPTTGFSDDWARCSVTAYSPDLVVGVDPQNVERRLASVAAISGGQVVLDAASAISTPAAGTRIVLFCRIRLFAPDSQLSAPGDPEAA